MNTDIQYPSPSPAPAPAQAPAPAKVTVGGVDKEEIRLVLSLAASALSECEPELAERLDRLSKAKW